MTPAEAHRWIAEAARRFGPKPLTIAQKVRAWRTTAQARFCDDPAKRKVLRKGRRAGGSEGIGTRALEVADTIPECVIPYVTLTKGTAKMILWPKLRRLNRILDLGLRFNETELKAFLPNGSMIWLTGADKQDEIEKLRGGDKGHPMIALDEVQSFGAFLRELVEEVAEPAVAEHDGEIYMSGTPNASCAGYFFDADTGKARGWSSHHLTLLDNPHFKSGGLSGRQYLEKVKQDRGWTEETPAYRREYLGLWCRSDEDLVYAFEETRNSFDGTLPRGVDWRYVLGIDIGFNDSFSLRSWAYSPEHPKVYDVEYFDAPQLVIEQMARAIQGTMERRKFSAIRVDQGGLGKVIAKEFATRYNIPCEPAEKSKKREFIQMMNGDFRTGKILVHADDKVYRSQLQHLQWDDKGQREDPRFPNDACDAALYAWRECRNWIYREPDAVPEPGTADALEAQGREMREEIERRQRAKKSARGGQWFMGKRGRG
jgi:hypothetical protein